MLPSCARGFLAIAVMIVLVPSSARGAPERSPFTGIRFVESEIHVQVHGEPTWHQLVEIDGITADAIRAHADKRHKERADKRIREDLVRLLTEMGHVPGATVTLRLKRLDKAAGETRGLEKVPMTAENRQRLWRESTVRRIERDHAIAVDARFTDLTRRVLGDAGGPAIAAAHVAHDLDQLEWHLKHEHSYLTLKDVPIEAALDSIRVAAGAEIGRNELALQVAKLLALLGDGHAGVRRIEQYLPAGYLPVLIEQAGGRLVAFKADRSGFVEPTTPYIVSIDGKPIERWLTAAAQIEADGSAQLRQRRAIRNLRLINYLRHELGQPTAGTVTLGLADEDGRNVQTVQVPVTGRKPIYGEWPRTQTTLRSDGIGYLRLAQMSRSAVPSAKRAMERFRDAKGLIIDVRGNTGGRRDLLRALLPFFLDPTGGPLVVNAARYRLGPRFDRDHLHNRFLYPDDRSFWTEAERNVINDFASQVRFAWTPSAGDFSEWHYMVVAPGGSGVYHFDKPVVVLMNRDCFSATDVFLSAFEQAPNMTLLGTPSGGGSGRTRQSALVHSGIRIKLSSMTSYRAGGQLFDGQGVTPNVVVEETPTDWIGQTDTQLDAAVQRLDGIGAR